MAFDQNGNYFPEWQNIGGDDDENQTPDLGPFAQALKQRFASRKPATHGMEIGHSAVNPTLTPHEDGPIAGGLHEAATPKGFGGGGMKSL